MDFPESPEKRKRLLTVMQEEQNKRADATKLIANGIPQVSFKAVMSAIGTKRTSLPR
jgi:hypothetical protein